MISNKENLAVSEKKREYKGMLRSKATFGEDITKRVNEPNNERFNFTLSTSENKILVPQHLATPTPFNQEIAPYEEAIINYIISTHN